MSERLLSLAEVRHRIPFSRIHLWRLERDGLFPRRVKVGERLEMDGIQFEILRADEKKLSLLRIRRLPGELRAEENDA